MLRTYSSSIGSVRYVALILNLKSAFSFGYDVMHVPLSVTISMLTFTLCLSSYVALKRAWIVDAVLLIKSSVDVLRCGDVKYSRVIETIFDGTKSIGLC